MSGRLAATAVAFDQGAQVAFTVAHDAGGLAGGGVKLGKLSREIDGRLIDGVAVNGSASLVGFAAGLLRKVQSGYLYHYAFAMILGLVALLALANHYWL